MTSTILLQEIKAYIIVTMGKIFVVSFLLLIALFKAILMGFIV